ncbi:hypothetical protein MTO96_021153 [Rhipicephalus appendiculatus]
MACGGWPACAVFSLLLFVCSVNCLSEADLYPYGVNQDQSLPRENDISSAEVQLNTPITFYGTEYSTLYVNDNGIVSFLTEVPSFFSAPFPLTYPIMAPLYSDVDTRGVGRVFYRETQEPSLLARFEQTVGANFAAGSTFRARSLFVATWEGVGYYERKSDRRNTFQLVVGSDTGRAYAMLLYPRGGVQWVQAEPKSPALPDAKAQAGFMAGDGRRFTALRGSGTDHVVNLDKMSNTAVPGQWLYQISGNEVVGPDLVNVDLLSGGSTCTAAREPCPPSTVCQDYDTGYCCHCDRGFFGNGKNCIANGTPQRVTGKLTGSLNEAPIAGEVDFHSYVDTTNGRTYTALSRGDRARNGFVLTGGEGNLTSEVRFKQTGHHVTLRGHFQGFDVFNMMKIRLEVRGSLPSVAQGMGVTVQDFTQDYNTVSPGLVLSHLSHSFQLEGSSLPIEYTVDTTLSFSQCPHMPPGVPQQRVHVSRNFIDFDDKDGIVRYAQSTKVTAVDGSDPCQGVECGEPQPLRAGRRRDAVPVRRRLRGAHVAAADFGRLHGRGRVPERDDTTATCKRSVSTWTAPSPADAGPDTRATESPASVSVRTGWRGDGSFCAQESCLEANDCHSDAQCVYDRQLDSYYCACMPGFSGDGYVCYPQGGGGAQRPGCNIVADCHPRAQCVYNASAGQHQCRCMPGYRGDGYQCIHSRDSGCDTASDCAPVGAACVATPDGRRECRCLEGFEGDGRRCQPLDECSTADQCDPNAQCAYDGQRFRCVCAHGYRGDGRTCRPPVDTTGPTGACDCGPYARCVYDRATGSQRCVCEPGTDGDGYVCRPSAVRPPSCLDDPTLCARNAECVAAESRGHVCQCQPGFTGDGRTCAPAPRATGEEYLLFGQGMSILQMPLEPSKSNPGRLLLMEPHQTVVGIAADCVEQRIYWTDAASGAVRRAFYNGSSSEVFRAGLRSPEGVALDWASRNLFWTDSVDDTVEVASLDGAYHHVIVNTGLVNPRGIAVHPALGRLYWSDWDRRSPRIESCHMDGSGRLVLVEGDGLQTPNMLALDLGAQRPLLDGRRTAHHRRRSSGQTGPFLSSTWSTGTVAPLSLLSCRWEATASCTASPQSRISVLSWPMPAVTRMADAATCACPADSGGARVHCGGNSTACNEVSA